jgi:hypothetical protein
MRRRAKWHDVVKGVATWGALRQISTAAGEDELNRYYERIVEAIAIPVIVQDAGGYVGWLCCSGNYF